MSNIETRFDRIQSKAEELQKEYSAKEGRFETQKEDYNQKKEELAEKGITFESGNELKSIYQQQKERVEKLLDNMESKLGISEEDEFDF